MSTSACDFAPASCKTRPSFKRIAKIGFSGRTLVVVGFFGASSIERLPTEVAITGCVKKFKGLAVGGQGNTGR